MRVCDEPTRLYKNIKYVCKINSVRLADIEEPREAGTISRFEKRGNVMNLPVWILYNVYRKTGVTIEDLIEKDLTADRKTESNSEKPNNCEHITEDGVTCAKYPACDDCLDNPLNKVKGSERLVKGKDEPTISKMEQVEDEPQTEETEMERLERIDNELEDAWARIRELTDEPQTERSE